MAQDFAPSFRAYRGRIVPMLVGLPIFAFIGYSRIRQPIPLYLCEWLVLLGLLAIYLYLLFRNTRVEVDYGRLTSRNFLNQARSFERTDISEVVLVGVYTYRQQTTASRSRLFVLGNDGRAILRWDGLMWSIDEMRQLAAVLDVPLTRLASSTSRDFAERYPHALSSIEAHMWRWVVILSAIIMVVVVGISIWIAGGLN